MGRRKPSGVVVAVLGSDGSGKSTLINELQKDLAIPFQHIIVFHLKPSLLDLRGARGPVTNPHGKALYPVWLSCLKIPYYVLSYALGHLFKVRPWLARSALVLFDRYYDDLLVDPRRYRYRGPMTLVRLGRRFVRRPDLVLVLDVPESELRKRKQEVSLQEMRRQRNGYRRLAAESPTAILLNGALPAAAVARRARDAIMRCLMDRDARYITSHNVM